MTDPHPVRRANNWHFASIAVWCGLAYLPVQDGDVRRLVTDLAQAVLRAARDVLRLRTAVSIARGYGLSRESVRACTEFGSSLCT